MVITHASAVKITEVTSKNPYAPFLKGCLCFGIEGNEYNLAGQCNYQYNLVVGNVIEIESIFYRHHVSEDAVTTVIQMVREDLELNLDNDEIAALLDNSQSVRNYDHSYSDDGEADWAIQQYQGILAHKLGYDCAKSTDEQGTVYIAYCVGRPLLEVPCA